MSLITISGYPSSGKSTRAHQIKSDFDRRLADPAYTGVKYEVVIVDDEASKVSRDAYDSSAQEKPARASVFALIQRSFSDHTIVICDGLNYIKGYRYQMYCAAREARCRVATVYVAAPAEQCREWHQTRSSDSYKPETFTNLIQRFEEPSSMARWDSPLFTLASTDTPSQIQTSLDELWLAVTEGVKKGPNAAVVVPEKPPPNALQTLTKTTSHLLTLLLDSLSLNPSLSRFTTPPSASFSPPITIALPHGRSPTSAELHRLKRGFETTQRRALANGGVVGGNWTEQGVGEGFGRFLEESWGTRGE